ncbi:MAG TPA: hypothetical protein VMU36_10275, partial [Spirochaetia bacterium]|nr:hypothetical protein [Spirochaetia bacterium]
MLFSIGNLITFFAVLLILVILRALDRNNRSLEKLKRFSDKITGNITALVEEKAAQLHDFSVGIQGSLTAGKELMARTQSVDEALQARAAEVEGIRKSLAELGATSSRVDQTLKKIRADSELADAMGKRIVEVAARLEKVEKKLPEIDADFGSRARKSLEAARAELMSAVEAKIGSFATDLDSSEKRLKDFSAYMARLEAREEQAEKERAAFLSRSLEAFEADLSARISRAVQRGETLEGEVFDRLSARIRDDEATFVKTAQALEMRLADYQGDVDSRVKALEESEGDLEALRASLGESLQKTAAGVRAEMKTIAAGLVAGWQAEITAAGTAREQIRAGLSEVHASLEDLKARAYQDTEKGLTAFEDEFFADLRQRATQALEKYQGWQADIEKQMEGFETEVKSRLASADGAAQGAQARLAAFEADMASRLSRSLQTIEMRLTDYQADVDSRIKALQESDGEAESLRASLTESVEKTAASVRAEMTEAAAELAAGWQREVSALEKEFSVDLRQQAAQARERVSAFEAEMTGRLSRSLETIEQRLTDYQGDVDSRVKALEESNGEVESLRASLRESMEKTAASVRAEMKSVAAELAAGWQREATAAAGAREQVHAALEELKARAAQEAQSDLSAIEKEFSADLRQQAAQALEKYQGWQADMEKRIESFEGELKSRLASADEAMQGLWDALRVDVEKARRDSSLAIEKETAGVRESLDAGVRKMQREIETKLHELSAELDAGRKEVTEVLDASRAEVVAWEGRARQQLAETEVSVAEKISRLASGAESSINTVQDEFASQREEMLAALSQERSALKGELKEMAERISAFEGELKRSAEATVEGIRVQMDRTGRSTTAALEKELAGLTEAFESRSAAMHKEIDARMKELAARLDTGSREAAAKAESALGAIRDSFAAEKEELLAASSAEREALKKQIAEMGERISTFDVELSRTTDSTMEAIQVLQDSLHEEVEKARRESSLGVEKDLASLRESLDAGSRRMQKEIETRMASIAAEMETNRKEVSQLLEASSTY